PHRRARRGLVRHPRTGGGGRSSAAHTTLTPTLTPEDPMSEATAGQVHQTKLSGAQRKAIVAGAIGNTVEWVDWAVYGTLAPVFASQFFPSEDEIAALLSTLAVFAVGFVMRPVGGAVLGAYADRHGRKKGLTLTISLMAGAAFVI